MKKIFLISAITLFIGCSVVPHHKSGTVVTDQTTYNLKGGHMFVDQREIHFYDKSGDFTLLKKEIKEINLKY
jgi:hypothetical protein